MSTLDEIAAQAAQRDRIDELISETATGGMLRAYHRRVRRDGTLEAALWLLAIWANVPARSEAHAKLAALLAEPAPITFPRLLTQRELALEVAP